MGSEIALGLTENPDVRSCGMEEAVGFRRLPVWSRSESDHCGLRVVGRPRAGEPSLELVPETLALDSEISGSFDDIVDGEKAVEEPSGIVKEAGDPTSLYFILDASLCGKETYCDR